MRDIKTSLLADGFIFLEAPRWRDGFLWTPDVFGLKLYRVGMDGSREVMAEGLPPNPNSFGVLPDGRKLIVSSHARQFLHINDGQLKIYADLATHCRGHVNDFAIDDAGRIYVGDFGYDFHAGEPKCETNLLRIEPDGTISVAATGLEFPNGIALLDGGRTLVVAETWRSLLTAFDRDANGKLSNRRTFADLEGRNPDGICGDAANGVWVPAFNTGEVIRVLEGGEITHGTRFPGSAVACHVGGPNGRTLFCTTYNGSIEDQLAGKPLGAVYIADLDFLP